jgi:hypothetical protein
MQSELLTTDELSARIKCDVRTIRERLKDGVLLEGVHYIRPFGGRKILFIWDRIAADMSRGQPLPRSAFRWLTLARGCPLLGASPTDMPAVTANTELRAAS